MEKNRRGKERGAKMIYALIARYPRATTASLYKQPNFANVRLQQKASHLGLNTETYRGGSTLGRGVLPPQNLGLAPQCDIRHCLVNSKHRHTGAKSSVLWLSKYAKMRFQPAPDPAGRTHDPSKPPNRLGWGYPSPYSTFRCSPLSASI